MTNVTWTVGKIYGSDSPVLFGQSKDNPNIWLEVFEGSSVMFIIRKMKDCGDKGERALRHRVCNIRQVDPIYDAKARELGMPGAGYAMELAEKL